MKFWLVVLGILNGFDAVARNTCNADEVLGQYFLYDNCLNEASNSTMPSYTGMDCYEFVNKSELFNNMNFYVPHSETVFSEKLPASRYIAEDMANLSPGQYVEITIKDGTKLVGKVGGFSYNSFNLYGAQPKISYAPNSKGPKISKAHKAMSGLIQRSTNRPLEMSVPTSQNLIVNGKMILDGVSKGNQTQFGKFDYSQVKPISQSSYQSSLQKEVLAAAGIVPGRKIVVGGLDFVVDEVGGEITDKVAEHIYAKGKDGVVKKIPIAKALAEKVAAKITNTSAYAALMKIKKSFPKSKIPILAALELAITPSQAGCATSDTMYIKNICEPSEPLELYDSFVDGSLNEKKEILKAGCYEIQDYLNLKRDFISKVLSQKRKEINDWSAYDFKCTIPDSNSSGVYGSFISEMNYMPDIITKGNPYNDLFRYTSEAEPICMDNSDISKFKCITKFKVEQLSSDKKTVKSWIEYTFESNSGGVVKSKVNSSLRQPLLPEQANGDPYDFIYGYGYTYDEARLTEKEKKLVEKVNQVPITVIQQRISETCIKMIKQVQSSSAQTEAVN